MSDYEWGARDLSGVLGPEPFRMSCESEARKQAKGDPLTQVVRRVPGGVWEVAP